MAYSKAAVIVLVVLTVAGSGSGHVAASGHAAASGQAAATGASQTAEYRAKYKVPDGFLLGAGTGSYQTEGAWNADGKGENVFDHFFHQKGRRDQANGDVAADAYHRYVEDIGLAAEMKLNVYRFSISWTRIFSDGRRSSKNQKGVDHYHAVIDEIIKKGMTPMITISHFDHPQTLEDEFGGWLSDKMVDAFVDYADFVFSEYGHKVHHWVTVNEPNMHCLIVYLGLMAPGVWGSPNNTNANIYRCMHTQILAHTAAYNRFQEKYNADKKSVVGLGAVTFFARPNTTAFEDVAAAARSNMFDMGLLLHPVVFGDYPSVVRETLRAAGKEAHLPTFTEEQSKAMKGAIDFVAVNVYFGQVVAQPPYNTTPDADPLKAAWRTDANVDACTDHVFTKDTGFANSFTRSTEWVMRDLLLWIKATFGPDLGVFFTENGTGMNETETGLDDWNTRAVYHSKYLREMFRTINEDQVKVLGYTVWSFLDDFEWSAGLMGRRFGIVHVDYETGSLNRTKKASAAFFQQLMEERVVPLVESPSSSSSRVSASFLLVLGLVSAIIRRLS